MLGVVRTRKFNHDANVYEGIANTSYTLMQGTVHVHMHALVYLLLGYICNIIITQYAHPVGDEDQLLNGYPGVVL